MWTLNDREYFEAPGLAALLYHNHYLEGKQGGFELIQHDERIATNGSVWLEPLPQQWSPLAEAGPRQVDRDQQVVRIPWAYPAQHLQGTLRIWSAGPALHLAVDLDRPLPPEWVNQAGLNLEICPAAYFGKTFHLGETSGVLPRQANGPRQWIAPDQLEPQPLAGGPQLTLAPEDPWHTLVIQQTQGQLELFDGRDVAQNGWFVVRGRLAPDTLQAAVEWIIQPHSVPGWRRTPVIAISQVGYHPDQTKHAILELDARTETLATAHLEPITPAGIAAPVLSAEPRRWGHFLRYTYAIFDFSAVRQPGMYRIRYGEHQTTPPFRIGADVYQRQVWQPTLETFLPVQMCHMEVRDRYQIWHGACHLDDALQAPLQHKHFDGYQQGPTTDTDYAPFTHIPHLDRGGWHDAGDDDLAAGSQAMTTYLLALIRETFGLASDQTTVDRARRCVTLHQPDGLPDVVQQVAHGAENLLSGYRAAGHSFVGLISGTLEQYTRIGDTASLTDNRIYDPALGPEEVREERAGRRDDRWAFTERHSALEYGCAAALAAASRVLRGWEEALAEECLQTALQVWQYEQTHEPVGGSNAYLAGEVPAQAMRAAVELWLTTGAERFRQHVRAGWSDLEAKLEFMGAVAVRALPGLDDAALTARLRRALEAHQAQLAPKLAENPFGIPYSPGLWGSGWGLQGYAVNQYFLHRAFPDLFDREQVLRVVNYVLGCHPASDVSLVSGVGARSVTAAYGYNRAEWSYIPGGNVSGPNLVQPDFPEMKFPFPFLWQQTEYVISGAATYIFCVLAADALLNEPAP